MSEKKDDKKKAPDAAAAPDGDVAPSKKSKLLFFVMLAAGSIALIGGSVGATLFMTGFFSAPPAEVKGGEKHGDEHGVEKKEDQRVIANLAEQVEAETKLDASCGAAGKDS